MSPRGKGGRGGGARGPDDEKREAARVPEAQVIPLRADESGGRTRWRLGVPEGSAGPLAGDAPSAPRSRAGSRGRAGAAERKTTRRGPEVPAARRPRQPLPPAGAAPHEPPARSQHPAEGPLLEAVPDPEPAAWEAALTEALAFLRRRLSGDYTVDDFGYDRDLSDHVLLPLGRPLYQRWFRVETIGMHNVPEVGGALLVANHSGTLPLDALMTIQAVHDDHPQHRQLRLLGADLMFRLPVVGELARKNGATLACNPDAERLMRGGELVGVFPEGYKGIGKPFRDRYKLQRFGRGGFVSAALRTGVPIIPCSIVGAEEIYPKIGDIRLLARLIGAPYFPVTPLFPLLGPLGAIPLPSKWYIEFGEPIRTDQMSSTDADDPMLVFNLTDQVRETIQHTLYRLLSQRRNVFLG